MRKVLIITYYFPPIGYAGSLRIIKLMKYLPQYGWQPVVLTSKGFMHYEEDLSLLNDIPSGTPVYRTTSVEHDTILGLFRKSRKDFGGVKSVRKLVRLESFFLLPDTKALWLYTALPAALKIIKNEDIDVILSTSPPLTSHLIAVLSKKLTHRPVVLDYRDAWSEDPFGLFPTGIHKKFIEKIEKFIVKNSDYVIAVNEPILQGRLNLGAGTGKVVPQGYDPEDFKTSSRPNGGDKLKLGGDKLKLFYTGVFSYITDPTPLFMAIASLGELKNQVEFHVFSTKRRDLLEFIKNNHLEDTIIWHSFVPHKKIPEILRQADVLVVTIDNSANFPYVSASKIYEYIGSGRPIFGVVPDRSDAYRFIKSLGNSFVVTPDDPEKIKEKIIEIYEIWRNGGLKNLDETVRKKFNRREQAKQLAKILDEVTK